MQAMNAGLIDEIVNSVLAQLRPAPAIPPAPAAARPAAETPVAQVAAPAVATLAEVSAPVITADLLAKQVVGVREIRIGEKSILTPAAADWLKAKRITWTRGRSRATSMAVSSVCARWCLIQQSVTPIVSGVKDWLLKQSTGWRAELSGTVGEAVEQAVGLVAKAEVRGVVIITEAPEVAACRANRNEAIRSAAVAGRGSWTSIRSQLSPNVVCVRPSGLAFMELRNLLKDIGESSPAIPSGWVK